MIRYLKYLASGGTLFNFILFLFTALSLALPESGFTTLMHEPAVLAVALFGGAFIIGTAPMFYVFNMPQTALLAFVCGIVNVFFSLSVLSASGNAAALWFSMFCFALIGFCASLYVRRYAD